MPRIEISHLGPIRKCDIELNQLNVFTGPQANGKSTVAKSIFFFRTIKETVLNRMIQNTRSPEQLLPLIEKDLRRKFLAIFGSTWGMNSAMHLKYAYAERTYVEVRLEEHWNDPYRNIVQIVFSEPLRDFLLKWNDVVKYEWTIDEKYQLKEQLEELFRDDLTTLYVPAGRSMITALSDQLAALALDGGFRDVDFCTYSYIQNILKLRPIFSEDLRGMLQTKLDTTQDIIDRRVLDFLLSKIDKILHGRYQYQDGAERLFLLDKDFKYYRNRKYVKINFASSGQQETVWILNLLFYYLMEREKVFLIVEEPESHLYPDTQKLMAEALAVFVHAGNHMLVTTHSPFVLGAVNNMLYAGELLDQGSDIPSSISPLSTLLAKQTASYFVKDGRVRDAMEEGLIKNDLIDHVADEINEETEQLMQMKWESEGEG